MKRVAIFIGLKLVEVMGVIVLLGAGGFVYEWTTPELADPRWSLAWWWHAFSVIVFSIALLGLAAYALVGIYLAIKANWKKAGELAERKREDQ